MCGRFARTDPISAIAKTYFIDEIYSNSSPSYNIAPGNRVAAVIVKENKRLLIDLKWGLVPSWAKDLAVGNKMINARAETVAEKPSFKHAVKSRRCLIIANGFYEWAKMETKKAPVYVQLTSGASFGFAGLYERWVSPEGAEYNTCTIITTEPNELLMPIHKRMPAIIPKESEELWLDVSGTHEFNRPETGGSDQDINTGKPAQKAQEIQSLLKPYPSEEMKWHYISTFVNSPKNNTPACIAPLEKK